jgi:hypothetical protein
VYLDSAQHWQISALGFYETHSKKRGRDLRAGDILSIEGGLGGSFLRDELIAGGIYGGQWKVTSDGDADFPSDVLPGRNHAYTVGPEATYTLYAKLPWTTSITARYLWDTGARASLEGKRFIMFLSLGQLQLKPRVTPP